MIARNIRLPLSPLFPFLTQDVHELNAKQLQEAAEQTQKEKEALKKTIEDLSKQVTIATATLCLDRYVGWGFGALCYGCMEASLHWVG